ncbi:phage terminase large subunit [Alicyclobacillus sp. SO9]|uniref:phage terminase large subunit n=1 Tax=Alicyclobacillus sp. SO9 TaxID=2665646 RepID=UPI0018E8128F|nr:phage terminase large subunit [Alicyclobacillus sp. SO9]QQE80915.1 phage terminase large subunit [Alicyclobacillus sp. SO9]
MKASLSNLPSLQQIQVEKARRSLKEFIRQAWMVLEPSTPYVHGWHLDAISEHLEAVSRGEIRNLLINMPPRHMKSIQVSVMWPAWEWLTNPHMRWLYSSYAATLSTRDSLKCRRLIESPWYQENFGHIYQLTSDQNVKNRYENDKSGYRIATSVGGAATGEGGDRIVVDDPHNVMDSTSQTMREATLQWWDETMSSRLNDPKTGAKVIVMQRVHEKDLSGHVLDQGGYDHLCLPAEYEGKKIFTSIGWSDPREHEGDLLWSERFGRVEIDTLKRAMGSYAAAGQLQQHPSPAEGGVLKRHWWKFYTQLPEEIEEQIQSWDLTFKEAKDNDYVVGQVWGRIGADRYLLDQTRDRMNFPESLQAVRNLSSKWPNTYTKLVEDKANGPALISTLKKEITGLIPVEPMGSKEARVAAVSPQIESGNVYLPHPTIAPWVNDLIEEAAAFPKGAHDDMVDAMSQALLRFSRGGGWLGWLTAESEEDEDGQDDAQSDRF